MAMRSEYSRLPATQNSVASGGYDYRCLPVVRIMKAFSLLLNALGQHGPVPEDMSVTTALRSRWLDARHA
jgi:hypothetical protein